MPQKLSGEVWTPLARRVLAPNAGPMTLDGTNSYVLSANDDPAAPTVVVDPGPLDDTHLAALAERPVELVLITHHHADHTEASVEFAHRTGAPVRALDPAFCINAEPLADGEEFTAAGVRIRVIATPGHTADSVCFHLPDDEPHGGTARGSVITGDTMLGRGTTVIVHPEGTLRDYLDSLTTLRALGPATVLPAHGPSLPNLADASDSYLAHRATRLGHVRDALERAGLSASTDAATVAAVTDAVYHDTPADVRFAAEASVRAQLAYFEEQPQHAADAAAS
ncbi:MAG: MBL fold metallo-hydrolase [Cryobacterium sp.]|nr:MBL fold metallo-hydrolase [Cryobacterium sp.]